MVLQAEAWDTQQAGQLTWLLVHAVSPALAAACHPAAAPNNRWIRLSINSTHTSKWRRCANNNPTGAAVIHISLFNKCSTSGSNEVRQDPL